MNLPNLNLRDLFWLVVVVAMGLGWWAERRPLAEENRLLRHTIETGEAVSIRGKVFIRRRCSGNSF
jgi:hypothetical protein